MTRSDPSLDPDMPDEHFFRALELRRTRALVARDMEVVEELHAADYQLITPVGKSFSREAYLAAIASGPFYSAWDVGPTTVRRTRDMALIRYQARLAFPSGRVVTCWHLDSYERTAGRWQAVWSQATQVATSEPA